MPALCRRWFFALGAVTLLAAFGCHQESDPWPEGPGPRVVVSFPPLYSLVKSVAGDDARVICLLTREGPHGYQYNPRDANLLRTADIFFVNGLTLDDHFTKRMTNACGNSKLRYVELAEAVPSAQLLEMKEHAHDHSHGHHHHHGSNDPHVWLGIPEAIDMVHAICKELSAQDPAHAADYDRRAGVLVEKLEQLQAEGKKKLAGRKIEMVTVHESLGYFARSFGLTIVDSIQLQPGDEPKPARLTDLAKLCVARQVRLIAVEPQYPENTARALLQVLKDKGVRDPDPKLVIIDPLETAEPNELVAGWYERKMGENIDNLVKALP